MIQEIEDWFGGQSRQAFLMGAAGTGKTTEIKEIVNDDRYGGNVLVLAPTNKACGVLKSKGVPASTIHSKLFTVVPTGVMTTRMVAVTDPVSQKIIKDGTKTRYKTIVEEKCVYRFDASKAKGRLLLIDEASMVPCDIWGEILTNTALRFLAVGDPNQLPPVQNMNDPQIIRWIAFDQYFHHQSPTKLLTINHRNKNEIGDLAEEVLATGDYSLGIENEKVATFDFRKFDIKKQGNLLLGHDIVIAWRNETCDLLNNIIRAKIFEKEFVTLNARERNLPLLGDRLYVQGRLIDAETKTVKVQKAEILVVVGPPTFDFSTGVGFADVRREDGTVLPNLPFSLGTFGFPKKNYKIKTADLVFGYALTCHKTQGSEYSSVCVIDEPVPLPYTNSSGQYIDAARDKWLYTAFTRARDELLVLKGI